MISRRHLLTGAALLATSAAIPAHASGTSPSPRSTGVPRKETTSAHSAEVHERRGSTPA